MANGIYYTSPEVDRLLTLRTESGQQFRVAEVRSDCSAVATIVTVCDLEAKHAVRRVQLRLAARGL